MIGGHPEVVQRLDPLSAALAPGVGSSPRTLGREQRGGTAERGYLHCGPSGAGHFVKMVHNGIAARADRSGPYRPSQRGGRLSTNARTPSWKSRDR